MPLSGQFQLIQHLSGERNGNGALAGKGGAVERGDHIAGDPDAALVAGGKIGDQRFGDAKLTIVEELDEDACKKRVVGGAEFCVSKRLKTQGEIRQADGKMK